MTGKKIKFALKMKDDTEVRNLQELRESFDLNQIVTYFLDGKLETWLMDRYYKDLAEKIGSLEKSDPELRRKLCEIFEAEYEEDSLSVEEIEKRSQRIRKLKEITDDETIIKHVDKVAFSQEELADLLDNGQETIYLCGTGFDIPVNKRGIRYIGIETKLDITEEEREKYEANDIELIDLFNDYLDETKEESKKNTNRSFGDTVLNPVQGSTPEPNNSVPGDSGQQQEASLNNAAQESGSVVLNDNAVAGERATETTGDDTSDKEAEDYREVDTNPQVLNDAVSNANSNMTPGTDDIRVQIPEEMYKIAETLGMTSANIWLFETVNGVRTFNLSQYKRSWDTFSDMMTAGMKQFIPENMVAPYMERAKDFISDMLKKYGYDANGNSLAEYVIGNQTPSTVNEPSVPYTTSTPVTNEPSEDAETSHPESQRGFYITLNGKKEWVASEYGPYITVMSFLISKGWVPYNEFSITINGKHTTKLSDWFGEDDVVELKF